MALLIYNVDKIYTIFFYNFTILKMRKSTKVP